VWCYTNKLVLPNRTALYIAWCITDSVTEDTVEAFLSSMQSKSPHTSVKVLMTDDGKIKTSSAP
jgi:hypothetical protein